MCIIILLRLVYRAYFVLSLSVLKYKILFCSIFHKESYEDPISKLRILTSVGSCFIQVQCRLYMYLKRYSEQLSLCS